MAENAAARTPNIFPFLRYDDAPAAIEWLATAFGFDKHAVHPGPKGTIAHAVMSLGPGMIMLASASTNDALGIKSPRELGAVNQGIYVCVQDADAHYERAQRAGAQIVLPVADTDYGSREYTARDPEGNLWSFGTYMPAK